MQRLLRIIGFAIGVLACAANLQAQSRTDSTPSELRKAVEGHIENLASDSRSVRLKAEQSLLKLGPRILPLLPPPELISDVAVREIVRRIRIRLDHAAAKESVQASRVTLKGERPVEEILVAVVKQTGNDIDASKLPAAVKRKTLKVEFKDETFWTVLDDVAKRAGFTFAESSNTDDDNGGLVLRVAKKDDRTLTADNSTAYRVAVHSAKWKPLFGDDANRLLVLNWSVTAEPRLRPLFVKYIGKDVAATAAKGKPLPAFSSEAKLEIPVATRAEAIPLRTALVVPKSANVKEVAFQGKLQILTAAASESIAFRNLPKLKGAAKRRGGVTVTIRDLGIGNNETSVGIAVAYDTGGPAFESHRTWVFHNRVSIQTKDGKRIDPRPGFKTTLQRDGAIGVRYDFELSKKKAAKASFHYVAPTLLIDVPVEFSFKKISLAPPLK